MIRAAVCTSCLITREMKNARRQSEPNRRGRLALIRIIGTGYVNNELRLRKVVNSAPASIRDVRTLRSHPSIVDRAYGFRRPATFDAYVLKLAGRVANQSDDL